MQRSRLVNAVGLVTTGLVLIIVLITKFPHGAWIALAAMAVLFVLMKGIRKHYDRVAGEIAIDDRRGHDAAVEGARGGAGVQAAPAHACGRSRSPGRPARTCWRR